MDREEWTQDLPITADQGIMSGVPVFRGTRVPVETLFDYIADGYTLEQFLDSFPTVKREDALQVLHAAGQHIAAESHS